MTSTITTSAADQAADSARAGSELAERVRDLAPLLREHAPGTEDTCQPADACVAALTDAGLFKMTVAKRFGGNEICVSDQFDAMCEVARHCPSTAWVAAIYMEAAFLLGLMSDRAQQDVYADSPNVNVTSVISPTGSATPTDGGYTVSGRWAFNSGSIHGDWALLALVVNPGDGDRYPALVLLPYSDLDIARDWQTSGLRGTGSNTVSAADVFVPEHRLMLFSDVLQGTSLSEANSGALLWQCHPAAFLFAGGIAVSVGLAKGAIDEFTTRLPGRGITYTNYSSQLDAPITHLQFGGAHLRVEAAEFHGRRAGEIVDSAARCGTQLSMLDRAQVRGQAGRSVELCTEAVDLLDAASGASSIMRTVPIQRYGRDMRALYRHALYYPPTNQELYGRVLLGLEPNSHFL